MRIGLDARAASHPQRGGFRTYTEQLIQHLPRVASQNQYIFYLDRRDPRILSAQTSNVSLKIVPTRLPAIGAVWREQFQLPNQIARDKVDLAHFPTNTASNFAPCPFVVTIHDTIWWDERPPLAGLAPLEALKRWGMFLYHRHTSARGAQRARIVITVSENSKRDLVQRLRLNPERVAVIYEAPATVFRHFSDDAKRAQVRARFGLREPFILAISSASPRKNARGLVTAYAQLDTNLRAAYQLVILWTHGLWRDALSKVVRERRLEERVIFLSEVNDEELASLYNEASLFVFPSLYEGFGLPPLEAMTCGTPVVASNMSSLPEILGDGALLVDPRDASELSSAIASVLRNPDLARELRARGQAWVQRYSWERCARETAQLYAEAYGRNRRV